MARRSASIGNPEAGLVVHAGRIGQVVAHLLVAEFERYGIADGDGGRRFFFVFGADIEPELFGFDDLLALVFIEQVNGLAGDDGRHGTVRGVDGHSLADKLLRVPAADRVRVDESVVVDVRHDEADLIGVAGVHHAQRRIGVATGDNIAVQIGADIVGETGHVLAHDFLHGLFVTRGARRFEDLLEELFGGGIHDVVRCPLSVECQQRRFFLIATRLKSR